MAAPTITVLTQGQASSPGSSVATASVSPGANKLLVLIVAHRSFNTNAFNPSSVTGCGLTWAAKGSGFISDSNAVRCMVYTATGPSPTSGAVTINYGVSVASSEWVLLEVDGAYSAGIGGGKALDQFVTSSGTGTGASIGMSTFRNADSGTLGIFALTSNQGITPDATFTELGEQSGTTTALSLEVAYEAANNNSIDPSWTTSSKWCGIGIEILHRPNLTNDAFASAIALPTSLPGSRTFDTTWEATYEAGEPILSVNDQSVWYTFTPTVTDYYKFRFYNVHFNGTNAFNIGQLSVHIRKSTTLADFTNDNDATLVSTIGVNEFGGGAESETIVPLEAGVTYTIKAFSGEGSGTPVHNGWTVTYDMSWEIVSISPPANDNWDDAEVMSTTLPGSTSGTTYDSTMEPGEYYAPGTEQSVWYKFTPTVTGFYLINFPASGFGEYPSINSWAQIYMFDGTGATSAADLGNDNIIGSASIDFDDQVDGLIAAGLTAGTSYYIQVFSGTSQGFNSHVMDFTIEWDIAPPVDNDDFADATLISGASGSEDFVTLGSSFETAGGEPISGYYNDPQTKGTVWFEWVCPATGDYKFKVELTDTPSPTSWDISFDLAVWTGSALNALTSVVRNWLGEEPLATDQRAAGTAVGFHAISGTTYWIQVTNWSPEHGSGSQLTWGANTVTGNTTTAPASFLVGRTDTHGNDETEPPPNFVTRLSGHGSWWFTDGQVGKVKWFKYVATDTRDVNISGHMWEGFPDSGISRPHPDAALLVYKGADYASLTAATTTAAQGSLDAAMMMDSLISAESDTWFNYFVTQNGDVVHMQVPVTSGDILWICLFGLYDADYAGSLPSDASEYEIDVIFGDPPTPNNNLATYEDIAGLAGQIHAYSIAGTTTNCNAESGEPAHGGFGPERSVWYRVRTPWQGGDFKFWVESAGDCVLSIYEPLFSLTNPGMTGLSSVGEDDDSGPGNWPEITLTNDDGNNTFFIAVDSKADTDFVLKYARLSTGTPPANDDFANAEAHTGGFVATGTTVGATGEPGETFISEWLGVGATDGVWYKYTAPASGTIEVRGICKSNNEDSYVFVHVFQGADVDNLTLVSSDSPPMEFYLSDDPNFNDTFLLDVVSGQDYYFRVATWSGGSEDFEIYVDTQQVYINIQPSGTDEFHGTILDAAEVYVNIQASGTDTYHVANLLDSATVPIKITVGGSDLKAHDYLDADTVRIALTIDSHDCHTQWDPSQLTAYARRRLEARAYSRWQGTMAYRRFDVIVGDGLEEC